MLFFMILGGLSTLSFAQWPDYGEQDAPAGFEAYALASGMRTIDASGTVVIKNPGPNQNSPWTPSGLASGVRTGLVWRKENVGLIADLGYHAYSDRTGSTSMAPLMLGVRVYSHEQFRVSFFAEGMGGAYRWTVNSGTVSFTDIKGIAAAGGGMDVRLTHRLVWRVFELQLAIAGARNSPLLSGGPSTGLAYRFGGH